MVTGKNIVFYNYTKLKLILLFKAKIQELFFMNYTCIFMLFSRVFVITSLNRFYITAVLAVTNLLRYL